MATPSGRLKQRTVDGHTIELHQLENKFPGLSNTPFMYEVRVDGLRVDDPVFTRSIADEEFEATIRGYEATRRDDRGDDQRGGGLFGAGLF